MLCVAAEDVLLMLEEVGVEVDAGNLSAVVIASWKYPLKEIARSRLMFRR